jgi:hypothetical protein
VNRKITLMVGIVVLAALATAPVAVANAQTSAAACVRYVSTTGSDGNPGTSASPWRTIEHAAAATPDNGCTVWVRPGTYQGTIEVERRFNTKMTLKASEPYRAILEGDDLVLKVNGARNIEFNGFEIRHASPGASSLVIYVDQGDGNWAEDLTFRNNVIHDSYDNDLLKLHNQVRRVLVEGNVFYNQGPGEEQMDVNGVTDVTIQDNIFFHDYGSSGRSPGDPKHFIVVKDSNDAVSGSRRVRIRRNVFLNWQGEVKETFVQVGADGKSYYEAHDTQIYNNLMIGNGSAEATAALGIAGASGVSFTNNTVAGDLPASAYALRVDRKDANPQNEGMVFANNIWSDPTGTMDDFSDGDPVPSFNLDNNLYWNGGRSFEDGDVVDPRDDSHRIVANPRLGAQQGVQVPVWDGNSFESGNGTIRQEFVRLVNSYGVIPGSSPAVDRSDPSRAPDHDILRSSRDSAPDLGAFEQTGASGTFVDDDGNTFEADIEWLAAEGITKGCNPPVNDRYCPDDLVTRGQMAAFIVRALDLSAGAGDDLFIDDDGSTFENDIDRLGTAGVTKGCNPPTNNRYCPDDFVTRGQMAAFIHRALTS